MYVFCMFVILYDVCACVIIAKWTMKKKQMKKIDNDFGTCDCRDSNNGCKHMMCTNFLLQIECNDNNCGCEDPDLCQNRQFSNCIPSNNVYICRTSKRGSGAFATHSFKRYELILEYVGEVISKEESDRRLRNMNENAG